MKIKVEVDLQEMIEGMFHDGNIDLLEEVKSSITRELTRTVQGTLKDSVDKLLSERITPQVKLLVDARVSSALDGLIDAGEITISGSQVSIEQHIKNVFMNHHGWNNPTEQIAKIAKAFGAEMKLQYNNCFAMNIVKNLSEQGLLNDDVAKALLAPPKN